MSNASQVIRLFSGGTWYPCVLVTAELASELRGRGYIPEHFNRLDIPIGAGTLGRGSVLVARDQLQAIAGGPLGSSALQIGNADDPIEISRLRMLTPRPIFVESQGLYEVPLVDRRFDFGQYMLDVEVYNQLGADRKTPIGSTTNSGTPWTADEILQDLISKTAIPTTIDDADATILYNVRGAGRMVGDVIDEVCAATGRIWKWAIPELNQATIERIDARTAFDVLDPITPRIIGGCVWSSTGTPPPGLIADYTPALVLSATEVPASVWGYFPDSDPAAADLALYASRLSTVTPADFGLEPGPNWVGLPSNIWAFSGVTTPLVAETDRMATDYYRRWVAGEMDVHLAGIVAPQMGGSCQRVVWTCDGVSGFRTHISARSTWQGYSWLGSDVFSGPSPTGEGVETGTGTIALRTAAGPQELLGGYAVEVWGQISAVHGATPGGALGILYNVSAFGRPDLDAILVNLAPQGGRPYADLSNIINAASVGDWVVVILEPDSEGDVTPRLIVFTETPATEECPDNPP